jgi:hypothetical protein
MPEKGSRAGNDCSVNGSHRPNLAQNSLYRFHNQWADFWAKIRCQSTKAAVLDYGARWAIEPTFSDFKSRGFDLEASPLEHADRLERLILIMALAMYWCVRVGRDEALHRPTPLEKKLRRRPTPTIGASGNSTVARYPGSHGGGVV